MKLKNIFYIKNLKIKMVKKIYDYFEIDYGQREYHSKRDLKKKKNGTPLISSKGKNRGIYGYFDIPQRYSDVISLPNTGTICYAIYQGEPCCIDDNCLVLTPKIKLTLNEKFYFVLLLRKQKFRFVYGRQVTPDRIGNIEIPEELPKWINEKDINEYKNISNPILKEGLNLNNIKWKIFKYKELFEIKKGKRIVISKLNKKGECPFVSSIDKNNGVSNFLDILPNQKENTITVNYDGSIGETYYQPEPFWALDSVNVLYPKFKLNQFIAMFLIVMIKKEKYRFNYGRKWHTERMNETEIRLPVDSNNNPDWEFMEDYIKSLSYSKALEN